MHPVSSGPGMVTTLKQIGHRCWPAKREKAECVGSCGGAPFRGGAAMAHWNTGGAKSMEEMRPQAVSTEAFQRHPGEKLEASTSGVIVSLRRF